MNRHKPFQGKNIDVIINESVESVLNEGFGERIKNAFQGARGGYNAQRKYDRALSSTTPISGQEKETDYQISAYVKNICELANSMATEWSRNHNKRNIHTYMQKILGNLNGVQEIMPLNQRYE